MDVQILAAAADLGLMLDGAAEGALKLKDLISEIEHSKVHVLQQDTSYIKEKEKGNRQRNLEALNAYNERIYELACQVHQERAFPLMVGGDHAIATASCLATQQKKGPIGVIWVDAHTDFNTLRTTETGNLHGCPLAACVGYENEILRKFHENPCLKPQNTVVVGARSIDREEWVNVKDAGITVFTSADVRRLGVETVMAEAYRLALSGTKGLHISYDLDVFDPKTAPGVSVPESLGLTREEGLAISQYIAAHIEMLCSFDLVELNPRRDEKDKTAKLAMEILSLMLSALKQKT